MTRRAWIERPRGHSKTTDIAISVLYALQHTAGRTGILAAADRDQAQLIIRAMQRVACCNDLTAIRWTKHQATGPHGTTVDVMPADAATSWGILPDFVICDEICHWTNPDFWHSLYSSASKRETCVLLALTNAGAGYDWQWKIRETARTSQDWYFHSLAAPAAPWITPSMLAEQREMLPGPVFARLWLNQWQASDGDYLSLREARACCDEQLKEQTQGTKRFQYIAAIDYAEKHDLTAACLAHYDQERRQVIIDRLDVARPTPNRPTPVAWVEGWIRQAERLFGPGVQFLIDDWQLLSLIQELEQTHDIQRIAFHSGATNQALALHLRQQILTRQIAWYPDCGAIETTNNTEDTLETELAQLIVRQTAAGTFRFCNRTDGRSHDDRSFVVGMASMALARRDHTPNFCHLTPPTQNGDFCPIHLA